MLEPALLSSYRSCSFPDGMTKVLITNGYPYDIGPPTEIIDLMNPDFKCSLKDFPQKLYGAVGGLVSGKPLICGGYVEGLGVSDDCYTYQNNDWVLAETKLTVKSSNAGHQGLVIDNKLVVSGGYSAIDSTELVDLEGSESSVTLPFKLWSHCQVAWGYKSYMTIGGRVGTVYKKETVIVNIDTER